MSPGQLITSAYINSLTNAINAIEGGIGVNPARALWEARLSPSTGVPVSASDVTGATTIYLTPFRGNRIALLNGVWSVFALAADLSLALGTLVANTNYDIFCFDNSGTPALEFGPAWTDDNTRATRSCPTGRDPRQVRSHDPQVRGHAADHFHDDHRGLGHQSPPLQLVQPGGSSPAGPERVRPDHLLRHLGIGVQHHGLVPGGGPDELGATQRHRQRRRPLGAEHPELLRCGSQRQQPDHAPRTARCTRPTPATTSASRPRRWWPVPRWATNSVTAYAQTAAATLTLVNPGVSGIVQM